MIKINGKIVNATGMILSDYLSRENYINTRIAIEYNGEILPKSRYSDTMINDGDIIEIVCFVGGG